MHKRRGANARDSLHNRAPHLTGELLLRQGCCRRVLGVVHALHLGRSNVSEEARAAQDEQVREPPERCFRLEEGNRS